MTKAECITSFKYAFPTALPNAYGWNTILLVTQDQVICHLGYEQEGVKQSHDTHANLMICVVSIASFHSIFI